METKNPKKIIVGLNNPGKQYDQTPHNIGKVFVEWLIDKLIADQKMESSSKWKDDKKNMAKILETRVGHKDIIFVLPKTFMNNSGQSVIKILNYYKIDAKGLMIVHDESDMLLGKSKLGFSHSAAGHKGVDSVIQNLKTQSFWRFRIGIRPIDISESKYQFKAGDYVVKKMTKENQKILMRNFEKFYIDIMRWIINS